jgi:UDP-N-acetylmuramyl pentapeptide phosphotransferase/UDP-N-acetylglucosamine-1-phosphate transferase
MMYWLIVAGTTALAAVAVYFLSIDKKFFYVPDIPNARSLHSKVVSRSGGIGILTAVYAGGALAVSLGLADFADVFCIIVGLLLVAISLLDDRIDISPLWRLLTHILVAVLICVIHSVDALAILPRIVLDGWAGWGFAVLFIVWMTNLYNFMDGMDGFAGGMAVIGFGTLGLLGWIQQEPVYALLCWIISAAAAGFLLFNFPPARIFMGDVGSSSLGFFAAVASVRGDQLGILPLWQSALIFSPFIVDATVTLTARAIKREPVWRAHRSHFYQRAVGLGYTHRQVVSVEYILMMGAAGTVLALHGAGDDQGWAALAAWLVIFAGLMLMIIAWQRRRGMFNT